MQTPLARPARTLPRTPCAPHPVSCILYPASCFLFFFGLYAFTLSPDVLPADSGEFQVVAAMLGVAHPPGFPFYTLLGKLFITIIPFGTPAVRLNLLSALLAALTLAFVCNAARRLTGSWAAGLLAASALGVSTTFWSQAVTANVRILTALCAAMAIYWLARLREVDLISPGRACPVPRSARAGSRDAKRARLRPSAVEHQLSISNPQSLIPFFLSLGLGISHHASLAFMGAVFVAYLLLLALGRAGARRACPVPRSARAGSRDAKRALLQPTNPYSLVSYFGPARRWLAPAGAFLAPFLFNLYLPIRGATGAFLAPPHLNTLPGFLEHVLARGFGGDFFYFAHLKDLPDRLAILGHILTFQFNPLLLIAAAIGLLAMLRRDWRLFLLIGGSFAAHSFVAITYRAPQTVEYMLPADVVLAIALGYGVGVVSRVVGGNFHAPRFTLHIRRFTLPLPSPLHLLAASFFLASFSLFLRNLPSYIWLSKDESAREYAEAVLNAAPPNALVLSLWHWATPMWYLQKVEGVRPDVVVEYVFPAGESLARNWVKRIADNVGQQRPVVVTAFYPLEYAGTPYRFAPLGPAWLVSQSPLTTYHLPLTLVRSAFGGRWTLVGFSAERSAAAPGETIPVVVVWQGPEQSEDISFFVQLIGPDGALYGQMDVNHQAAHYAPSELLVDRYLVTVRPDAPPGDYTLIAGAYTSDGVRLTLEDGADHRSLIAVHLSLAASPLVTRHSSLSGFLPGTRLVGYDYDNSLPLYGLNESPPTTRLYLHWRLGDAPETAAVWYGGSPFVELALPAGPGYLTTTTDLPAHARNVQVLTGPPRTPFPLDLQTYSLADPVAADRYVPLGGSMVLVGERHRLNDADEVTVDLDFLSTRPLVEDDIVKVDLIGPDYSWRVESNSVPAGGAIPTLKWVAGSFIHDRRRLVIPPGATPGPARLELAVYDHFTGRVLPILDPRLAMIGATVLLGEIENP